MRPRLAAKLTLTIPLTSFVLASCIHITNRGLPPRRPAARRTAAAAAKPEDKPPFKPWDDVLKDSKPIAGFLKAHLKRDNTTYLELRPEQLEKDFGMVLHLSRGV